MSNFHNIFILLIIACSDLRFKNIADIAFWAKAALESDLPDGQHLNPYSIYFTDLLKDVVVPLLEQSGPSKRIVRYLEDLATVICLLCLYLERRGFNQEAEKVRLTVQWYLSKLVRILSVRTIYGQHFGN